jgi:hypothetical protein
MKRKKVYCSECDYHEYRERSFQVSIHLCHKALEEELKETCIQRAEKMQVGGLCEDRNYNNNCKHFTHKTEKVVLTKPINPPKNSIERIGNRLINAFKRDK